MWMDGRLVALLLGAVHPVFHALWPVKSARTGVGTSQSSAATKWNGSRADDGLAALHADPQLRADLREFERLGSQIGFDFASLHVEDAEAGGQAPLVPASHARIAAIAGILQQHPQLHAHVDGHCGVSAPPEIEASFSEERAHIVARLFGEHGVPMERVSTRGWGSAVARAALTSTHPSAACAKAGHGWADVFIRAGSLELPPRPDFYERLSRSAPPSATYPVFYMPPGTSVGATVALHFFEPRYKLLIHRAWHGDRLFVYCAGPPLVAAARGGDLHGAPEEGVPAERCVLVRVDAAFFYPDGRADMYGYGEAEVVLRDAFVENGTDGLFSAGVEEAPAAPSWSFPWVWSWPRPQPPPRQSLPREAGDAVQWFAARPQAPTLRPRLVFTRLSPASAPWSRRRRDLSDALDGFLLTACSAVVAVTSLWLCCASRRPALVEPLLMAV